MSNEKSTNIIETMSAELEHLRPMEASLEMAEADVKAYKQRIAVLEKEARRHKYRRCLLRSVIAEMNATHFKDLFYGAGSEALADEYNHQITIHYKWHKRWLGLAEKFKEEK